MSHKNNVTAITDYKREFSSLVKSEGTDNRYAGFSKRLNELIQFSQIETPDINDRGHISVLADIFGKSYNTAASWVKEDKAPKKEDLENIVTYLLSKSPATCHPMKAVAWLLYGEDVLPSPISDDRQVKNGLMQLSTVLVSRIINNKNINTAYLDRQACIKEGVRILEEHGITSEEGITETHLDFIELGIRRSIRNG